MKHLKMFGLLAVAVAALMALAGSAYAAPQLTSPGGSTYTGELDLSLESTVLLKATFEVTCTDGTVKSAITTNNETHAVGANPVFALGKCNAETVDTLKPGILTVKDDEVIVIESEVTFKKLGVSCIYGGNSSTGTKAGTITDSSTTGTNATIDIHAILEKKPGSGFLCVNNAELVGSYWVTTPNTLYVT